LVVQIMQELPLGPPPARWSRFEELLEAYPHCLSEVAKHYFQNIERDLDRSAVKAKNDEERKKQAKSRVKLVRAEAREMKRTQAARAKDVRLEAERLKKGVVLLALIMPNGKPMRDCLGSEMREFGSGYNRIAKEVGLNNRVGDRLSEAQAWRLME
jgi:hypothetical protein